MTLIKRSALLPYAPEEMFELVDRVEDYPLFLPWCSKSHILHRDSKEVEATLELAFSGIHKSFTTRNTLNPFKQININLVTGPFKHLEGIWCFKGLGEEGCRVELELEFELTGHFLDKIFEPVFNKIANSLVELFSKRAREIYGKRLEH